MRVLIVEDEPQLLRAVREGLCAAGYAVDEAADGEAGLHQALHVDYDAIVLDLMLPGIPGTTILERLRAAKTTPVLVLTARDAVADKVACLDAGADDYLTKPFAIAELQARVRAMIRRGAGRPDPVVSVGELRIDTAARQVHRGGERVDLTPMEFALLELLALRRGAVVSRTAIYEHLWNDDAETMSNVVDVYIANLRQKLGRELITTRRGEGYIIP